MRIVRFTDQYDQAAPVYEMTPQELRTRDDKRGGSGDRWLAVREGVSTAALSAYRRPDSRVFVSLVGRDSAAHEPLLATAGQSLMSALHTFVDEADRERIDTLRTAGFDVEVVEEAFRIRFDRVLSRLRRSWMVRGVGLHPADAVDPDRLVALDNVIRQDVPGCDGWQGDRSWLSAELAESPPFDRSAYLVAVEERAGDHVGLIRIWRNRDGPRLGLIGVVRSYRNTTLVAALLKQALTAASRWGHDSFVAETSPENRVIYRRMESIGAESLGRFLQMVRPGPDGIDSPKG